MASVIPWQCEHDVVFFCADPSATPGSVRCAGKPSRGPIRISVFGLTSNISIKTHKSRCAIQFAQISREFSCTRWQVKRLPIEESVIGFTQQKVQFFNRLNRTKSPVLQSVSLNKKSSSLIGFIERKFNGFSKRKISIFQKKKKTFIMECFSSLLSAWLVDLFSIWTKFWIVWKKH